MHDLIHKWQKHMSLDKGIAARDKDFYLSSDEVDVKTQQHITPNVKHFKDKTVVDVGCNTGYWLLQFYINGAAKVIGIEPRKQIVEHFNKFADANSIPCRMLQGYHPALLNITENVDCISMMSVDEEIYDFDEYIYKVGCKHPNSVLLLQTMLIDERVNNPFPTADEHHSAPVKRFKGLIYKFEENNNNHRDGFDPHIPVTDSLGLQNNNGEEASYIHTVYSKDYMSYIIARNGFDILDIKKIDKEITRPMTQSGKSGKLWWISAKNRNMTSKEPLDLFEYKTK